MQRIEKMKAFFGVAAHVGRHHFLKQEHAVSGPMVDVLIESAAQFLPQGRLAHRRARRLIRFLGDRFAFAGSTRRNPQECHGADRASDETQKYRYEEAACHLYSGSSALGASI